MSKEKAVDYFDRHPSSTECHITSDGRVFHTIGSAQGFAQSLKDDKVKSYTRAQFEVENIPVVDSKEFTGGNSEGEKEARFKTRTDVLIALGFVRNEDVFENAEKSASISATDVYEITDEEFEISTTPLVVKLPIDEETGLLLLDQRLIAFDTETAKYPELLAFAKELKLATDSNKTEDLVKAIVAAQETLKNKA